MACATSDRAPCVLVNRCATHRFFTRNVRKRAQTLAKDHIMVWMASRLTEREVKRNKKQNKTEIESRTRSNCEPVSLGPVKNNGIENWEDEQRTSERRRIAPAQQVASDVADATTCCLLVRDILAPIRMPSTLMGTNKSLLMDLIVIFTPFSSASPLM